MGFHKGLFVIQNNPQCTSQLAHVVSGWIDERNQYGFHKRYNKWVATDLVSGLLVTSQLTRRACVEWIESNADRIAAEKETQSYKLKVESFRDVLIHELKKIEVQNRMII